LHLTQHNKITTPVNVCRCTSNPIGVGTLHILTSTYSTSTMFEELFLLSTLPNCFQHAVMKVTVPSASLVHLCFI